MDPVTHPGPGPTPGPPDPGPPKPAPNPPSPPPKTPIPPAITPLATPTKSIGPPPKNNPAPPPPASTLTDQAKGGAPPSAPSLGSPPQPGQGQSPPQNANGNGNNNGNAQQTSAGAAPVPGPTPVPAPTITLGAQKFTYDPQARNYISGSTTLAAGGPAVTIAGTPVALAPSATAAVFGGSSTSAIPQITPPRGYVGGGAGAGANGNGNSNIVTLTLGGQGLVLTLPTPASGVAGSSGGSNGAAEVLTIGTQSLTAGGPAITVSDIRVSLLPFGNAIVVGSGASASTFTLPAPLPTSSSFGNGNVKGALLLTLNGATYTASTTQFVYFVVDGTTLVPGGPGMTVSEGTLVSFLPISAGAATEAASVVVGSSTEVLAVGTDTVAAMGSGSSSGLGDAIMSGIGGQGSATGTASATPLSFTGNAVTTNSPLGRIWDGRAWTWRSVCVVGILLSGWTFLFSLI